MCTSGWVLSITGCPCYYSRSLDSPDSPSLSRLAQATFAISTLYNALLLLYMLVAGSKVVGLFSLTLPLRLTLSLGPWISSLLSPHKLFIPITVLMCVHFICTPKLENGVPRGSSRFWRRLLITVALPLLVSLLGWCIMYKGCQPCSSLDGDPPPRPRLIAHRGCGGDGPENSLVAFKRAIEIPLMVGLETDIQISSDGVPFLLHDPVPARTTNIRDKCPTVNPWVNASTLAYSSGDCPLTQLSVDTWEHKDDVHSTETVPTASEYLTIAKRSGMVVIFDVMEPPVGHAHHVSYLNITLEAITNSGIDQSKVWWLPRQNRDWVIAHHPHITHITKTIETAFEDFAAEHIVRINDDWTTPIETLRAYQAANISINMYFVDSPLMYSYAWCVGVESVTTDHCTELAHLTTNTLHQVCASWIMGLRPSPLWVWPGLAILVLQLVLVICWDKLCKR